MKSAHDHSHDHKHSDSQEQSKEKETAPIKKSSHTKKGKPSSKKLVKAKKVSKK